MNKQENKIKKSHAQSNILTAKHITIKKRYLEAKTDKTYNIFK